MRILTGKLKGRPLKMSKPGLRPTQDKTRKAIFDILGEAVAGAQFLELFAGSGAVGIEALSCGAGMVWFVENDREAISALRDNLSGLGISNYEVIPKDVFSVIEQMAGQKRKFDIIFLDPPYYQDLAKKSLLILEACDILSPSGLVIIQHFKKDIIPDKTGSLELFKQKKYGDTFVSFYQIRPKLTEL
jgi:16S rRNA (guanine(966)-N(2))-methyltransferase RsmD